MSTLHLSLLNENKSCHVLNLQAEEVIVTTLFISPGELQLPTLASIVNIVACINGAHFDLLDEHTQTTIASVVNSYFFEPPTVWRDQYLTLPVVSINSELQSTYQEIDRFRRKVVLSASETLKSISHKTIQDRIIDYIHLAVKNAPHIWRKILDFLVKNAVERLFDILVPIPLRIVIASAFWAIGLAV